MRDRREVGPDRGPEGFCIYCCCCCCYWAILYVIFVVICTSLYGTNPPDYDLTQPIVPGDYVKIVYEEKDYDSLINRSLTISVDDNYSTVPLELYQGACDHLILWKQFTQSNIHLTNCSRKCEVDRFLYFVNSDQSVLTYNITDQINSTAKFLLFDDYYVFKSFISGNDINERNVLQEVELKPYDHFVSFDLTETTRPSYYFVAFESTGNENSQLHFVSRRMQVLYDVSISFREVCTFCDHFAYLEYEGLLSTEQCFILHINTASTDVLPVHVHGGYSSTAILLSIFLGGLLVAICCCCCCMPSLLRAYSKVIRDLYP